LCAWGIMAIEASASLDDRHALIHRERVRRPMTGLLLHRNTHP
jgi:hypothetical protein